MLEQLANAITFYAFYVASSIGKTGLTVTIDVYEATNGTPIVSAGSATELGGGLYYYTLASGSVDNVGEYVAIFKTADTSVDQKQLPAIWTVGRAGVEDLDATISSRLSPTVAGRTLDVTATGAAGVDWANIENPTTTVGLTGTTIGALSQAAASVVSAVSGSTLTIHRGDTFSVTLTGLSANTGYVSIDFSVKTSPADADTAAIVRIRKNASGSGDGLLYLNGAAGTAAQGSITVNSATSLTITLAAAAADDLTPVTGLYYDVQYIFASSVLTATSGVCNVSADITRAVA